jgi:hypothetical protein
MCSVDFYVRMSARTRGESNEERVCARCKAFGCANTAIIGVFFGGQLSQAHNPQPSAGKNSSSVTG